MRLHLLLIFLFCYLFSYGQLESRNWFFTQNRVAITPSGITTGLTIPSTFSGSYRSSSISDAAGNLLFATNGATIIDRNLAVMPGLNNINLLGGNGKVLIQQIPNSTRYYVFYVSQNNYPDVNSPWTLKYAVVDLSLNGGNGDVINYNNVVETTSSPSFSLAAGSDPSEAWLVTHKCGTDSFFTYKITNAGLDNTPVRSKAGTVAATDNYIFKDMKTSFDGKLIACVAYKNYTAIFAATYGFTEVFNFDATTGTMTSRVRTFRRFGYFFSYLTLEFSPDNRLLYTCAVTRVDGLQPCGFGSGSVTQYNLCYNDSIQFERYSMVVATDFRFCGPFATWGAIQMGADKRIHMPFSGIVVSTINNPNRIGSFCNYVYDSYQLPNNNFSQITTPDFHHKVMEKALKNNIIYDGGCHPNPITFHITNDTIAFITWDFGDPASATNSSAQLSPSHVFSAPGMYTVTAQLYNSQHILIETVTELVDIKDPGKRILENYPRDTSFCAGNTLNIRPDGLVNGIYHWYQLDPSRNIYGSTISDSFKINYSGVWYVEMKQNDCNGCTKLDSIRVTVLPKPYVNLGADRNLCQGDSIIFTFYDPATYTWSNGASSNSITVKQGGLYWVEGEYLNNGCPSRDSVLITEVPGVNFSLPGDTTLCNNQTLLLSPGIANASYVWQNSSTQNNFTVNQPGTYWVRITSANFCTRSDTIIVNYLNAQQANLGNDTTLCAGASLVLHANIPNAVYEWSTGSTNDQITVNQPGSYWVKVNNGVCTVADTINVINSALPGSLFGTDTILCKNDQLTLYLQIGNATYTWQDGSQNFLYIIHQPGLYWVEIRLNSCVVRDTLIVGYYGVADINLGPDLVFCPGNNAVLNAGNGFAQYAWNNGLNTQQITVDLPGSYSVTGTTTDGCKAKDTVIVNQYSQPVVELGPAVTICKGENHLFNAGAGFSQYAWNTGSTAQSISANNIGVYNVMVTDINGCHAYDTTQVTAILPSPTGFLPDDTAICSYGSMLLKSLSSYNQYNWNTGSNASSITITKPGIYWLMVKDNNNCTGKDTVTVALKDCMQGFFIPSAFTPNGDGKNDTFYPLLFGNIQQYRFNIYNRWGEIVFSSSTTGQGWNGNNAGVQQDTNVFTWICRYQLAGEEVKLEKGTVVLIR